MLFYYSQKFRIIRKEIFFAIEIIFYLLMSKLPDKQKCIYITTKLLLIEFFQVN